MLFIYFFTFFFSSHLRFSVSVFEQEAERGVASAELTEQKIGLMLLEVCHKAGGSNYLRQIYHIIQGNEVGKHSFSPAIKWLLAWGRRLLRRERQREGGCCLSGVCWLWSSLGEMTSRVPTNDVLSNAEYLCLLEISIWKYNDFCFVLIKEYFLMFCLVNWEIYVDRKQKTFTIWCAWNIF